MFNLFSVFHAQRIEYGHQLFRAEQAEQVVFQRKVETGFTRIALTSGTSAELVVNSSGFMTLCTDDL